MGNAATLSGSDFVAPGHYEINNRFLKKSPSACFGNERRKFSTAGREFGPGPDIYNAHRPFSAARSKSGEKNAPRITIGNAKEREGNNRKMLNMRHPGPMSYDTNKTLIGGD
jgi:hypothetical protein